MKKKYGTYRQDLLNYFDDDNIVDKPDLGDYYHTETEVIEIT